MSAKDYQRSFEKTERLEVLNEMKKSWGIDASKGTTLDHKIQEQTQERVREYGLEI